MGVERVIGEGRGRDGSDDVTSPGVPRATRKLEKTRNDYPWSHTRKETLALELQLPELSDNAQYWASVRVPSNPH